MGMLSTARGASTSRHVRVDAWLIRFPGVHIDGQHAVAGLGERDRQVQGRGRLRDSALLVGEGNHLRAARAGPGLRGRGAGACVRREAVAVHAVTSFGGGGIAGGSDGSGRRLGDGLWPALGLGLPVLLLLVTPKPILRARESLE
jgi:hypothetical protein